MIDRSRSSSNSILNHNKLTSKFLEMKTTFGLYLLVTLCGSVLVNAGSGSANNNQQELDLEKELADMKEKVTNIITFNVEQLTKLQTLVTFAQSAASADLNAMLVTEVNNTRLAVDDAIAKGKDAEHCKHRAAVELENIKAIAEVQFDVCANASYRQIINSFKISTKIINEGQRIIASLNMVLSICNGQIFTTKSCLDERSKKFKTYIECFDKKNDWYPNYRKMVSEEISHNIYMCLSKEADESAKKIAETEDITKTCIEGAE